MDSIIKTFIIIGGAGLLGTEFSKILSENGDNVVVADFNIDAATSVCDKLISAGVEQSQLMATTINIVEKDSILMLINKVQQRFGSIDGVVNTAYPRNANYGRKFEQVEFADFCENTNLNLGGYFLVAQQFAEYFSKNNGGDIINISSVYGVIAPKFEIYDGTPMTMPVEYAVIKSGLIHLGKYIAKYYRGKKVRINTISPGGIFDNQNESFVSRYNDNCNSVGMLSPKEIANVVQYIFSSSSHGISGQNIIVDDGFTL
ncbi:MAG: SDR family oxidoreductase [Colwellia sp.]|uniref:oxidoreductase n=1 Tax=Alteromonadales TaxID=135622 RepID=UPI001D34FC85|nr:MULTISPECIES: oxidoreductase [Alteromonadales]NQZ26991.1 SDR family oxidoreductase [Colwellia sp.]NRA78648.1 SDR family oxidoreductase [Pseudoalteromonas sp.]